MQPFMEHSVALWVKNTSELFDKRHTQTQQQHTKINGHKRLHLVADVPEGEVGERHAGVAPQRDALVVGGQPVQLTVSLQQLRYGLQTAWGHREERRQDGELSVRPLRLYHRL